MTRSLLQYAEALRTGRGLELAAGYRQSLRREFPVMVAALEAEMPHKPQERRGGGISEAPRSTSNPAARRRARAQDSLRRAKR